MASLNKVQLIGHLGKDPDCRYMPNGDQVVNITVATTDTWKDKNSGEKKEATEWHRVVFFRRLAEIAGQYLTKGSSVYVEGSLKTRKWQDKDGNPTCAADFNAGSVCRFYGTSHLGLWEVCLPTTKRIQRMDIDSWSTIPVEGCPVWSGE